MNRLALAAGCLALLLTGCATGSGEDDGGLAEDPAGRAPELPTGAEDVVLRIETGGGFVPADYAFGTVPTVLVTGSGLVVQPAPQAVGAAVPRLRPLLQHTVDEATLEELARLADDAGLLTEPPDYGKDAPQVTDMPSTTVTLTADGETYAHSAYALGFEDEQGPREALADFVDDALDLLDDGEAEPYRPERLRLSATESGVTGAGDGTVAWPDAVDLATVGTCTVVEDPAAVAAVAAVLDAADADTSFTQAGRTWSVVGSTVLPGEDEPCADR